jgi:hypothetical protein
MFQRELTKTDWQECFADEQEEARCAAIARACAWACVGEDVDLTRAEFGGWQSVASFGSAFPGLVDL